MESKRNEAIREKEIAEKKFIAKDIVSAKKIALKAQSLCPEIEGICQMIATFDVYLCAEKKVNGETDWYSILSIDPSANDETIKKQYRKLALLLHPDNNKSIGAEGAFRYISEAWNVLSDKSRRFAYDQNINAVSCSNDAVTLSAHTSHSSIVQKKTLARSSRSTTFWTSCGRCKMQYEYLRIYLNHNLLCPNCHEPFLATEIEIPANASIPSITWSSHKLNKRNINKNTSASRKNPSSSLRKHGEGHQDSKKDSQRINLVGQSIEKVSRDEERTKRKHSLNKVERPRKRRLVADNETSDINRENINQYVGEAVMSDGTRNGFFLKDLTVFESRKMLMDKARMEINKKLKEWNWVPPSKSHAKKIDVAMNGVVIEQKKTGKVVDSFKQKHLRIVKSESPNTDLKNVATERLPIAVPDPDFHNFDKDYSERSFNHNQVWAVYDDDNGMPRFYALIQKVLSLRPFKMQLSWLNSKTNAELGPMNWVRSGFTKTCGDFRIGRYGVTDTINIFSHKVKYEKGTRGMIRILPRKGDVWALYKNWSQDWSAATPNEIVHKYSVVEVLNDYIEEQGISVVPLVKIFGFKTVFYRHMDPDQIWRIPREEMFRFSHQVPAYLLTGKEAENAPKDCLELDPAAIPLELLQIITEIKEEEIRERSN